MPANTKKAERATLLKARRQMRRKLAAHKAAKHYGANKLRERATHPHRRHTGLRVR
ncbi:hypothetical protein FACS1894139_03350 [Planctomycetales bacterium]|jgi:hypothetical protein|nr:hypothetical protein [Planctomycetota bacterium]GHS93345.1 hypothetical protein FACS1894107_11330 [Planctomycetales bacterium]GHT01837.1 hypothetical protein FACS1894108_15830 [Planctomycetales bacterium]GHT03331.1 hypothetical protein FACS1894139_03350 [Planctomycetales bacterium]GHV19969.1 hypothetical protein AGMMS49959_06280 [Planctomycetales bacterium]